MKTRIRAVAALLALALAAPVAAGPVQDTDLIHAYCVATDITQGRTFYSDVFPVQSTTNRFKDPFPNQFPRQK